MQTETHTWQSHSGTHHWCRIHNPRGVESRPLLLLHGAGVEGEPTWRFVIRYLSRWRDIWFLDLPGMGQSQFANLEPTQDRPALSRYVSFVEEGLEYFDLDFERCDVAAYSFGAMVWFGLCERHPGFNGLAFLLEPAMLASVTAHDVLEKGRYYQQLAKRLLQARDIERKTIIGEFMDLVSPKRIKSSAVEQLGIERLAANYLGLAHALLAITGVLLERADEFVTWEPHFVGCSFVGALTPEPMHQRHAQLARDHKEWSYVSVAGADHSLVFTKPRIIAQTMDECAHKRGVTG